jgi:hypothetical protein
MTNPPLPQSNSAVIASEGIPARSVSPQSRGVRWPAIFAGAAGAAALSLVLFLLGWIWLLWAFTPE